eukprot:jgi/Ulvmu1/11885/UM081_0043.1
MTESATPICELRPRMDGITVHVKVVENSFISETGKKQVSECVVGDETATILLKARGKECDEITAGRSLLITACKVDMYHGSMRLVLDLANSTISEAADVKPKASVNMSLLEFEPVLVSAYTGGAAKANGETVATEPVAEVPETNGAA